MYSDYPRFSDRIALPVLDAIPRLFRKMLIITASRIISECEPHRVRIHIKAFVRSPPSQLSRTVKSRVEPISPASSGQVAGGQSEPRFPAQAPVASLLESQKHKTAAYHAGPNSPIDEDVIIAQPRPAATSRYGPCPASSRPLSKSFRNCLRQVFRPHLVLGMLPGLRLVRVPLRRLRDRLSAARQ